MAERDAAVQALRHGRVRELVINRPQIRNALDLGDRVELGQAVQDAAADPDVRALVLSGAGSFFCAGGNIAGMTSDPAALTERFTALTALVTAITRGRLPIVAAVDGGAYGLGLGLAALADVVVSGRSARFAASFGRIALTADTGVSWSLTHRIGWARTRRLLLTAETFDAQQAHDWGLVDHLTDDGEARERAIEIALGLAELSPVALAATRRLMAELPSELDDALAAESAAQTELLQTEEFKAARAAFLARRPIPVGDAR